MPRVNLTDAFCRSAKPIDGALTEYADVKERGLALRVTPAGVKSWTLRYRNQGGQQKRLSLGRLDDVPLVKARAIATSERAKVHDGDDPAKARKIERQRVVAASKLETVEEIGWRYMREAEAGRHRPNARRKKASSIASDTYYFTKHIVPAFGAERLADLTRARIQAFVNDMSDTFSLSTAIQSLTVLQGMFMFAARQELVAVNPCQFVTVPRYEARDRVLTDAEVRALWHVLDNTKDVKGIDMSRSKALALMLAAVTCQRRGEIAGVRKTEIDFGSKLWTIPGSRTKNHRTHLVPLSALALRIVRETWELSGDGPCLFPSARDPQQSAHPSSLTHAIVRAFRLAKLGEADEKSIENARLHDLRRTGATNMTGERIGIPRFIVSQVLNHTSDSGGTAAVTAVYDRNAYLPEKRRALDAWAGLLLEIVEGRQAGGNVVRLTR